MNGVATGHSFISNLKTRRRQAISVKLFNNNYDDDQIKSNHVLLSKRKIKGNTRRYPYQGCSLCKINGRYHTII